MASEAVQHGTVTLEDEKYPRKVVDFKRDAGHTITLTATNRWGDAGVSILGLIESWKTMMRKAKFGGVANRVTLGVDAWEAMRDDDDIRDLLKTDYNPGQRNGLDLNLGVREGLEVEVGWPHQRHDRCLCLLGLLRGRDRRFGGLHGQPRRCSDFAVDPRRSLLRRNSGCQSRLRASGDLPEDVERRGPVGTFVMSQSAPIMVPMNPNACSAPAW